MTPPTTTVGLVGARGYVGEELVRLVEGHPRLELAWVSSRTLAGRWITDHVEGSQLDLRFEDLGPAEVARRNAGAVILALPNRLSPEWVRAIDAAGPRSVIVDVSADHRFDDDWAYGLPELNRVEIRDVRRIANPGCYATAGQLAIAPLIDHLAGPPIVFGVSGYSGAGTTPSPRNHPETLRDNLLPYSLTGHLHEREMSHHLGTSIHFTPHVAPFFRGITLTISLPLRSPLAVSRINELYRQRYGAEPLVRILPDRPPVVRDIAGRHHVEIGGFAVAEDGSHAVLVATIDNLLKGAATQAIQNLNLAFGHNEFEGIITSPQCPAAPAPGTQTGTRATTNG